MAKITLDRPPQDGGKLSFDYWRISLYGRDCLIKELSTPPYTKAAITQIEEYVDRFPEGWFWKIYLQISPYDAWGKLLAGYELQIFFRRPGISMQGYSHIPKNKKMELIELLQIIQEAQKVGHDYE